ncbi:hypothetical protein V1514DRAFT_336562 [Lipomyces japonicus]|uniref:uncharacterized protein n=1 Tax=Lipomyces japonicus TaxID=56871 RepID=UPI0034CE9E6B
MAVAADSAADSLPRSHSRKSPISSSPTNKSFVLTGQQEHYLKKELISLELERELALLSAPDALRKFGAPFRSVDQTAVIQQKSRSKFFRSNNVTVQLPLSVEIKPGDSDFPILRHVFVDHVRNFPFLEKTKETEFWQDKVQTFWESFATKRISSTQDRTEETKRKRLAFKVQKLVELMMSSGIRTTSGLERGVTIHDSDSAYKQTDEDKLNFMVDNASDGHPINGFDVNIVGVKVVSDKKRLRHHEHLEFIIRTNQTHSKLEESYVSRKYSDFRDLHQELLHAFPQIELPRVPMKNKNFTTVTYSTHSAPSSIPNIDESASTESTPRSSISHVTSEISVGSSGSSSPPNNSSVFPQLVTKKIVKKFSKSSLTKKMSPSAPSLASSLSSLSTMNGQKDFSRLSLEENDFYENFNNPVKLPGELQRLSLRAFLRSLLAITTIAESDLLRKFLTDRSFHLSDFSSSEVSDINLRKEADNARLEEQYQFFQIATQRARELDQYMKDFKKEIIQRDGLSKFFSEIRQKDKLADLAPQYHKFIEWARIEVAATIYHLFVGQDNASELLAQTKHIHRMMPYAVLKNVIRFSNPVSMMKAVLDLFLAQPFGQKSLLQRILSIVLYEDIKVQAKAIHVVRKKINDDSLGDKIQQFVDAEAKIKDQVIWESETDAVDIIVAISKTDELEPFIEPKVVTNIINSWVSWNIAVEDPSTKITDDIRWFSNLKSLLKLMTRKRDKDMILSLSGERVTIELLKDVFTIFYQPLIKVYKSANVHNSIGDISVFVDDLIKTVEECEEPNLNTDPNFLVQKFIDLCERHQESFYKFVHEVHIHDDGLFMKLMLWIEEILRFLREGPNGTIDMNDLVNEVTLKTSNNFDEIVDRDVLINEVDSLIDWNKQRKLWREKKLRDRLREGDRRAAGENVDDEEIDSEDIDEAEWKATIPQLLRGGDFGLHDDDLDEFAVDQDVMSSDEDEIDEADLLDPIEYERRARARKHRRGGRNSEPLKPVAVEIPKVVEAFMERLRIILS